MGHRLMNAPPRLTFALMAFRLLRSRRSKPSLPQLLRTVNGPIGGQLRTVILRLERLLYRVRNAGCCVSDLPQTPPRHWKSTQQLSVLRHDRFGRRYHY